MEAAVGQRGRRGSRRASSTAWSSDEDDRLRYLFCVDKLNDWDEISSKIGTKAAAACKERWGQLKPLPDAAHLERRFWTEDEDEQLKSTVDKYGKSSWMLVACYVQGRTAKQCQERYRMHEPGFKRDKLTSDEWEKVCRLQKQLGNKWTDIANALENRSANLVKNAWYSAKAKARKTQGNGHGDDESDGGEQGSEDPVVDGEREDLCEAQIEVESFDLGLEEKSVEKPEPKKVQPSRKRKRTKSPERSEKSEKRSPEKTEKRSHKKRKALQAMFENQPVLATVVAEVMEEEMAEMQQMQGLNGGYGPPQQAMQHFYPIAGPIFFPGSMAFPQSQVPNYSYAPIPPGPFPVRDDFRANNNLGSSTDQSQSQDIGQTQKSLGNDQDGMEGLQALSELADSQQARPPVAQAEGVQYQLFNPFSGFPYQSVPFNPYWLYQLNISYQNQFSLQHQIEALRTQPIMRPIYPGSEVKASDETAASASNMSPAPNPSVEIESESKIIGNTV